MSFAASLWQARTILLRCLHLSAAHRPFVEMRRQTKAQCTLARLTISSRWRVYSCLEGGCVHAAAMASMTSTWVPPSRARSAGARVPGARGSLVTPAAVCVCTFAGSRCSHASPPSARTSSTAALAPSGSEGHGVTALALELEWAGASPSRGMPCLFGTTHLACPLQATT